MDMKDNKTMNLNLITARIDKSGGAERFARNLMRGLCRHDIRIHLITRLKSKPAGDIYNLFPEAAREKIRIFPVSSFKLSKTTNLLTFYFHVKHVLKSLPDGISQGFGKSFPLDVFRPPSGTHRAFVRRMGLNPLSPATFVELAVERKIVTHCARVVLNSNFARTLFEEAYPEFAHKATVIYNGVDTEFFSPGEPRDHEDVTLLFVSNNFMLKGFDVLAEGAARACRHIPNLTILAVGQEPGPEENEIIDKHGLSDRITCQARGGDMRDVYRSADILIHPTRHDAMSNVCLEAMACGLPVITTKFNGAAEVIREGGAVLSRLDAESLAQAVTELCNPQKQAGAAAAARAEALEHGINEMADQYLALYHELLT